MNKIIITALFIFIPLFLKFPAIRLADSYVAIRLEDFLILFSVLFFSFQIFKNYKFVLSKPTAKAILLYLLIGAVSVVSAIFVTESVATGTAILHWLRRIEYFSLFFVGLIYLKNSVDEDKFGYFIKLLLLTNLFIFIYGFGQRYLEFPVITTQNEEYSKGVALRWVPGAHINSTFAGHYDLASYLVLTMPIFIGLFFVIKDRWSKIILGLSIAFGFWLLAVAVSRISIVAFLVASVVSLFLLKKYKAILLLVAVSVVFFGFSPDLQVRYKRIIDVAKQKISSVVVVKAQEGGNVNEDRSTSIRLNVEWPRAIRAFTKNPILGTGYSSITLATDNDYLRALGETGILGLSAFLFIFYTIYQKFKDRLKFDASMKSVFTAGFIGSTIGILIIAIFIDIFEASKFASMYWLFAGLIISDNG